MLPIGVALWQYVNILSLKAVFTDSGRGCLHDSGADAAAGPRAVVARPPRPRRVRLHGQRLRLLRRLQGVTIPPLSGKECVTPFYEIIPPLRPLS